MLSTCPPLVGTWVSRRLWVFLVERWVDERYEEKRVTTSAKRTLRKQLVFDNGSFHTTTIFFIRETRTDFNLDKKLLER